MTVSKEDFIAAIRMGAPASGPFDITDEDRESALRELAGLPEPEAKPEPKPVVKETAKKAPAKKKAARKK